MMPKGERESHTVSKREGREYLIHLTRERHFLYPLLQNRGLFEKGTGCGSPEVPELWGTGEATLEFGANPKYTSSVGEV